jgi:hypothetical protein
MWTVLGFPLTSVVIPVWLLDDGTLPNVLQADENGIAPFCDLALQLKDKVFSDQNDASENYLNLSSLMNKENSGVRQKLIPAEEDVLEKSKTLLNKWRSNGIDQSEVKKFYDWVDNDLYLQIKTNFSIN